jgi:hypothetical protein
MDICRERSRIYQSAKKLKTAKHQRTHRIQKHSNWLPFKIQSGMRVCLYPLHPFTDYFEDLPETVPQKLSSGPYRFYKLPSHTQTPQQHQGNFVFIHSPSPFGRSDVNRILRSMQWDQNKNKKKRFFFCY